MTGWVAVTHTAWFDYLAQRVFWDEVNFWTPSDYYTFHGEIGAPLFFKLKAPRNVVGGFGFVARFSRLPDWLAWDCFGQGNGAETYDEFKQRLIDLRSRNGLRGRSPLLQIGCIVLTQAVFFPRDLWIAQPTDWPSRNLRHKRYDLECGEGQRLWVECQARVAELQARVGSYPASVALESALRELPRYGAPRLVAPRLGQGAFRVAVTEAYGRACAVTHEHSLPALEAAHIKPFAEGGPHEVRNGLLLRADLHRLLDTGYVTVTPKLKLEISTRLYDDFKNGRSYRPLHGAEVQHPRAAAEQPGPELLQWHNETRFLG